jgi:hypothetical protein
LLAGQAPVVGFGEHHGREAVALEDAQGTALHAFLDRGHAAALDLCDGQRVVHRGPSKGLLDAKACRFQY